MIQQKGLVVIGLGIAAIIVVSVVLLSTGGSERAAKKLSPYRVEYKPAVSGSYSSILLVNISGPANELGLILTNPEGWSDTTFISRRDLIDNFESVEVFMCEGRNPPAGKYELVIKTITPEKVVYKTAEIFTPPSVTIIDGEIEITTSEKNVHRVGKYSITVKNKGDLPICLNGEITVLMPDNKVEVRTGFRGIPHGEVKIEGIEPSGYWWMGRIRPIKALITLYSEEKEVASSRAEVKMTTR